MVESSRFDLIHHQHIHYYSLNSIKKIAELYSFKVVNYEFDRDHYGTLRVELTKNLNKNLISLNSILYDKETLIKSTNSFREFCKEHNNLIENTGDLYCYGASLMLPITFYYYPYLNESIAILDSNKNKSNLKYVNIETPIVFDDTKLLFENYSVFITANATRYANRVIINMLSERNCKNIFNPFPSF